MEAGLDLLGAVELRNLLQATVGNSTPLSATLIFDHPTARQVVHAISSTVPTPPQAASQRAESKGPLQNAQSGRLDQLLADVPKLLAITAAVPGNREADLHPCGQSGLKGSVCVVSGASGGIGHGIAVRFAKGGAAVCVLGRSDGTTSWGSGTLSNVVSQVKAVRGVGMAIQCDLSKPEQITAAVDTIISTHDQIDVLVNNASAHYGHGVVELVEKRFDLLNDLNIRGCFLLTRAALPHMEHRDSAHVLTMAPLPIADRGWIKPHTCYSTSKICMGMLSAIWSVEFPHVHFNTLWPTKMVATFAITNMLDIDLDGTVAIAHVADPAYRIMTSDARACSFRSSDVLATMGITDIAAWRVKPQAGTLDDDFMIDIEEPIPEYRSLPDGDLTALAGKCAMLVGDAPSTDLMAEAFTTANAHPERMELMADIRAIQQTTEGAVLDMIFVSAGGQTALGTLGTDVTKWDSLFHQHVKVPNFVVDKSLPSLRGSEQPAASATT